MKKIIFLNLILIFILSSCGTVTKEQEDEIKNNLLNGNNSQIIENTTNLENSSGNTENIVTQKEKNYLEIDYLTDEKFLEFDNFTISDFKNLEKEITGKTLVNVDKIIVTFSNKDSSFPDDSFQLKQFKAGDKTFLYRAFQKYENLDYGENIFVFEAYSGSSVSKLQLVVNLEKQTENKENQIEQKIAEPIKTGELPYSSTYGNPVNIGNGNITYSDIKGLEIEKIGENSTLIFDLADETGQDNLTDFLKEKYSSVFYWNTRRNISGTKGLTFFMVRASGKNYIYEKHYYTGMYYGVLEIEKGDLDENLTLDEKIKVISELNTKLKEKNNSFENVKVADKLFADLID